MLSAKLPDGTRRRVCARTQRRQIEQDRHARTWPTAPTAPAAHRAVAAAGPGAGGDAQDGGGLAGGDGATERAGEAARHEGRGARVRHLARVLPEVGAEDIDGRVEADAQVIMAPLEGALPQQIQPVKGWPERGREQGRQDGLPHRAASANGRRHFNAVAFEHGGGQGTGGPAPPTTGQRSHV